MTLSKSDLEMFRNANDIERTDFAEGEFGNIEIPKGTFDIVDKNAEMKDRVNFLGQGIIKNINEKIELEVNYLTVLGGRHEEEEMEEESEEEIEDGTEENGEKKKAKVIVAKITKSEEDEEEEE